MEAGVVRRGRTLLAILTAGALVVSMLVLLGGTAEAEHIDWKGKIPPNCVEFQAGETGTTTLSSGVSFTLDSWTNTPGDPHTVNFTLGGLTGGQYVDISVKSGTNIQEAGPYGNGSHSYSNGVQWAISHIRLCVFEEQTTTTTVGETTTTAGETTTTVGETTTTVGETTTTVGETTTTVEVGGSTVTSAPTTTIKDEVLGTEVLPFTGSNDRGLLFLAAALALLGSLVVYTAKHVED